MSMEAQTEVMQLQAKKCCQSSEAAKRKNVHFPPEPPEEIHLDLSPTILILDFWPPEFERINFRCFKSPTLS